MVRPTSGSLRPGRAVASRTKSTASEACCHFRCQNGGMKAFAIPLQGRRRTTGIPIGSRTTKRGGTRNPRLATASTARDRTSPPACVAPTDVSRAQPTMPGVPRKGEPSSPPDLAPTAARALLAAKAEGQRTVARCSASNGRDFPDQSLPWACLRRRPSSTCRFSIRRPSTISTQAGSSATATIGCSSRRDGIHTDDDPRLPTTRLYRRQITAFDPSA